MAGYSKRKVNKYPKPPVFEIVKAEKILEDFPIRFHYAAAQFLRQILGEQNSKQSVNHRSAEKHRGYAYKKIADFLVGAFGIVFMLHITHCSVFFRREKSGFRYFMPENKTKNGMAHFMHRDSNPAGQKQFCFGAYGGGKSPAPEFGNKV
jgi:hypothetical protein